MHFETCSDQGVATVTTALTRLDASTADELRDALLAPLDAGARALILDLSNVAFLDSSALGALIAAAKRIDPAYKLAVTGIAPAVARLFALTHMDRIFSLHTTRAEAFARLTA